MGRKRKTEVFNALATSKLLYGLCTLALSAADRRRVDAFQNHCLRQIWGILPSYVSRIKNVTVLQMCGESQLSKKIFFQQLLLYGKAGRAREGTVLRDCAFCHGSLRLSCVRFVRRVGRPRLEWVTQVQNMALQLTGSWKQLEEVLQNAQEWRALAKNIDQR